MAWVEWMYNVHKLHKPFVKIQLQRHYLLVQLVVLAIHTYINGIVQQQIAILEVQLFLEKVIALSHHQQQQLEQSITIV